MDSDRRRLLSLQKQLWWMDRKAAHPDMVILAQMYQVAERMAMDNEGLLFELHAVSRAIQNVQAKYVHIQNVKKAILQGKIDSIRRRLKKTRAETQ